MKKKKLLWLIAIILFVFLFLEFFALQVAAARTKLTFVEEPSYYCYKKTDVGKGKYYYLINVTIKNSGDVSSYPTDIKLFEDGIATVFPSDCRGVVFEANEQKSFSFDWCTMYSKDTVEIVFSPSNSTNVKLTEDNSGSAVVYIGYNPESGDQGLPGFSLLIFIVASVILFMLRKKL